jgi:hypothetical protein
MKIIDLKADFWKICVTCFVIVAVARYCAG